MKYAKNILAELSLSRRMYNRTGQSMTSLLVGIAIMGCVGAGAAKLTQSTHTQEQSLSAKNGAAELMDTIADEIRTQTRYSDLASKYGGTDDGGAVVAGWKILGGDGADTESDEFVVRTTTRKICNASPSTNCNATHVDIEIADKSTGETVLKQTVTRAYTHYEESHAFPTLGSLAVPEDTIAVRYTSDSGRGNSGGSRTTYGYDLKINSVACGWDYKPNNASPRPNGCVACDAPSGIKQYKSGDCALGTCGDYKKANSAKTGCEACSKPTGTKQYLKTDCSIGTCETGKKSNSAHTGCEAITCPSGQKLQGDSCVAACPEGSVLGGTRCYTQHCYEARNKCSNATRCSIVNEITLPNGAVDCDLYWEWTGGH